MAFQPDGVIRQKLKIRGVLDVIATVMLIAACAAVLWTSFYPSQSTNPNRVSTPPREPVSLVGASRMGSVRAKVVLVIFSDFQCPYCGMFARDTLPRIVSDYVNKGTVQLAFKHLPLTSIHPMALRAAMAADCANRKGRFWQMHDEFFREGLKLDEEILREISQANGLNAAEFDQCMAAAHEAELKRDVETASKLSITSTPVFLVGTADGGERVTASARINGSVAFSEFATHLDQLIAKAGR